MAVLLLGIATCTSLAVNRFFGRAQMVSAGAMGFMHGTNDAPKDDGDYCSDFVCSHGKQGTSRIVRAGSVFLRIFADPGKEGIALWIKVTCALVMAAGTAVGGWRIIKTLGHKMVKLHPINGFAAETSSATVILTALTLAFAVSTTHHYFLCNYGCRCCASVEMPSKWRCRQHDLGVDSYPSCLRLAFLLPCRTAKSAEELVK
jgi:PiT family inorganic phosphate transporter